jgi:hypothetical protein
MLTYAQIMTEDEFHETGYNDGPCIVWRRAGQTTDDGPGGFWLPLERDSNDPAFRYDYYHVTRVNETSFHASADCPREPGRSSGQPEVAGQLTIGAGAYDADGYDAFGYDAAGYDRRGYNADGYDREGYDADGYDEDGDDRYGNNRKPDARDLDLAELWGEFRSSSRFLAYDAKQAEFLDHLRGLVRDPDEIDEISFCGNCDTPEWDDDLNSAASGTISICESCWDDWSSCYECDDRFPYDDLYETLEETHVCERCRDRFYSYCEHCDGYYPDAYAGDHEHDDDGCDCESPQLEFAIRNDGCAPLANDTRVTVTLPAGAISDEGLKAIRQYLGYQGLWDLSYGLAQLGNAWQTRNGNYAKRLSRLAYQSYQIKLSQEVMSEVGNIARNHSTEVSVDIEVTRDLNMSAEDFYHEGSCWWTSYSESRCALKTNGGFGLRSFSSYGAVNGRAWVMPLRQDESGRLRPTFNTGTPDAFVVFNGYGALDGYAAPRIIAHMAGWTYRKIDFSCDPMYVNAGGYLIAAEDIAEPYTDGELCLDVSQHASLFERELVNA